MYIRIECDIGGGWGVDVVPYPDIDQLISSLAPVFDGVIGEIREWAKTASVGSMVEIWGDNTCYVHVVCGTKITEILSEGRKQVLRNTEELKKSLSFS